MLLELAVAASAETIVTHNLRDFRGTDKWGVAAVTPSDFLKLVAQSP
jgi:predicted nucleic acid-binding protein